MYRSCKKRLSAKVRSAQGAHQGEVVGDQQFAVLEVEEFAEGLDHPGVGRYAALEENRWMGGAALAKGGEKVSCQGKAQPCGNFLHRYRLLLEVDHVRLGKDGAPAGHPGRPFRLTRYPAKGLDGQAEPFRLLVEKGAGTGGTELVEGMILDVRFAGSVAANGDELGILAADLKDVSRLSMKVPGGGGVRDDLVDHLHAGGRADQLLARAGNHGAAQKQVAMTDDNFLKKAEGSGHRLSGAAPVAGQDDLPRLVRHGAFDADRADINAKAVWVCVACHCGISPLILQGKVVRGG